MNSTLTACTLQLREVFDPAFVSEVIDRKLGLEVTPRAELLRSATTRTLVRKRILATFAHECNSTRLSVLTTLTPQEVKGMAKLGDKSLKWFEEYLNLLGIVLPSSESVHGMSKEAREFLATL